MAIHTSFKKARFVSYNVVSCAYFRFTPFGGLIKLANIIFAMLPVGFTEPNQDNTFFIFWGLLIALAGDLKVCRFYIPTHGSNFFLSVTFFNESMIPFCKSPGYCFNGPIRFSRRRGEKTAKLAGNDKALFCPLL